MDTELLPHFAPLLYNIRNLHLFQLFFLDQLRCPSPLAPICTCKGCSFAKQTWRHLLLWRQCISWISLMSVGGETPQSAFPAFLFFIFLLAGNWLTTAYQFYALERHVANPKYRWLPAWSPPKHRWLPAWSIGVIWYLCFGCYFLVFQTQISWHILLWHCSSTFWDAIGSGREPIHVEIWTWWLFL